MQGTIQVDLDGIWTYRRYSGAEENFSRDNEPVYEEGLINFLELFEKFGLKATFFIVGKDLENDKNKKLAERIIKEGHEIANHSMTHPANFSGLEDGEIEKEIRLCAVKLKEITGKEAIGFRAPTFSVDERCLAILEDKKYLYDASLMPSFIAPYILRIAHCILRKRIFELHAGEREFGKAPLEIYRPDSKCLWKKGDMKIFEVPITVTPFLRLPMHSTYAFLLGKRFFDAGFKNLMRRKKNISYLFHGIDLVDLKKHNLKLPLFPEIKKRREICGFIVNRMKSFLDILTTEQLVRRME